MALVLNSKVDFLLLMPQISQGQSDLGNKEEKSLICT